MLTSSTEIQKSERARVYSHQVANRRLFTLGKLLQLLPLWLLCQRFEFQPPVPERSEVRQRSGRIQPSGVICTTSSSPLVRNFEVSVNLISLFVEPWRQKSLHGVLIWRRWHNQHHKGLWQTVTSHYVSYTWSYLQGQSQKPQSLLVI